MQCFHVVLELQMQNIGSLTPNNFSWHNSAVKFIGIKGTQNYVKSEQLSRSDSMGR